MCRVVIIEIDDNGGALLNYEGGKDYPNGHREGRQMI